MSTPLVSLPPDRPDGPRIFCFHHAGGGAGLFAAWPRLLGPATQVATVLLPGRERLFREPLATDVAGLVRRVSDEILALGTDVPYVLFGHSLGAILAFEVGCRLERYGSRPPSALILSGRGAVQLDRKDADLRPSSALPEDELIDLVRSMGGTPAKVLENPELLALILPRLRADFRLAELYRWDGHTRTRCDLLILGGKLDASVSPEALARWAELTTGELTLRTFDGDHFFVASHQVEVCRVISEFLDRPIRRTMERADSRPHP